MKSSTIFVVACLIIFACLPLAKGLEELEKKRTFLPLIRRGGEVFIIDCEGRQATEEWLQEAFGRVTWQNGTSAELISVSCDDSGISALGVYTGNSGDTVIRYWPGAPELPDGLRGWYDLGIYAQTGSDGWVWFPMGHGDYYFPPNGGASCIWIHPDGDLICGLGMLGGTNHVHLNSVWRMR